MLQRGEKGVQSAVLRCTQTLEPFYGLILVLFPSPDSLRYTLLAPANCHDFVIIMK